MIPEYFMQITFHVTWCIIILYGLLRTSWNLQELLELVNKFVTLYLQHQKKVFFPTLRTKFLFLLNANPFPEHDFVSKNNI